MVTGMVSSWVHRAVFRGNYSFVLRLEATTYPKGVPSWNMVCAPSPTWHRDLVQQTARFGGSRLGLLSRHGRDLEHQGTIDCLDVSTMTAATEKKARRSYNQSRPMPNLLTIIYLPAKIVTHTATYPYSYSFWMGFKSSFLKKTSSSVADLLCSKT